MSITAMDNNGGKAQIHFRRITDREIVSSFDVPSPIHSRQLERILVGALMNMRESLFLDDSEVEVLSDANG